MRKTKDPVETLWQGKEMKQGLNNREATQGCQGASDTPKSLVVPIH